MQQGSAEMVGLQALGWLASSDEVLPAFLGATGISPRDLAAGADDPSVLASVLDFILGHDAYVIAFCDSQGLSYTTPLRARAHLPGGDATLAI